MKAYSLVLTATGLLFFCVQCTTEVAPNICNDVPQKVQDISYSLDVSPIIAKSCALPDCHVGNFPNGDFTFYDDLKIRADNGALYFRLTSGQMPPSFSNVPALTICDVNTIVLWINEGAKNN